ncbi:MAG: hypothetical protein IK130_00160 [Oscillospiraceae bacterium]|nr:hypothetical protein [Oscillospiraceae bacterium]
MLEYQGEPCIMCGKTFTEDDDIVVCPECGTPYHRACWKEQGACINTVLHETGQSWMEQHKETLRARRREEKQLEEEEQAEEREREGQPRDGMSAMLDGVRINPNNPTLGLDPDEDFDGVPLRSLAEFVSTNRLYYLPLFRVMKKYSRKATHNLISFFVPELYFANRKMWGAGLLVVFVNLFLNIPYLIVSAMSYYNVTIPWANVDTEGFQSIYRICWIAGCALKVICFLFSNYWYYKYSVRKIRAIRKRGGSEEVLRKEGGTSFVNVILMIVIELAASFAMMMMIMLL